MAFKKLCKTKDVPIGDSREYSLGKQNILAVNLNGQFHCLSARCTHAGAPLVNGMIRGEELQCPWHGNIFRVTDGSLVFAGMGPEEPLSVYPCEVRGDYLFVDLQSGKSTK
jgi:nitrite reductase/ring-hydroxylating ferredoxin subunit